MDFYKQQQQHAASSNQQRMGIQISLIRMLYTTIKMIQVSLWKVILYPWERLFVSEKSILSELEDLESEAAAMPVPDVEQPVQLQVTDMNDNTLKIQIKTKENEVAPRKKHMSESSDDIEVVHSHEPPKLHSILKQRSRTTSESSDEVFAGSYSRENSVSVCGSEDAISEEDEPHQGEPHSERTRTVSFNDHIDQTVYKTNMPISSLSHQLKNKRKKQRRRDAHKTDGQKRRRQRSSGSMSSDTEETGGAGDDASTASEGEHHGDVEAGDGENVIVKPTAVDVSDPSSSHDESCSSSQSQEDLSQKKAGKNKSRKNKRKNKKNKNNQKDAMASEAHQPPETNNKEHESVNAETEVVNGESEGVNGVNGDDDAISKSDTKAAVPEAEPDMGPGKEGTKKAAVKLVQDAEDSDDNDCDDNDDDKLDKDTDRTKFSDQLPAKPDTVLSWEDGAADPQHKTQCAFEFSNSLMYDLDED